MIYYVNEGYETQFSQYWYSVYDNMIIKWQPGYYSYKLAFASIKDSFIVWEIDVRKDNSKIFYIKSECVNEEFFFQVLNEKYPDDLKELLFDGFL